MAVFDDCIAYWKCDEVRGQTRADGVGSWDLADASGNVSANSGKFNNGALADSYNAAAGGTGALYASTSTAPAALSGSVFTLALWVKLPVSNSSSTMHSVLTIALSMSHNVNLYYTPSTGKFTWHFDNGINTDSKTIGGNISNWRFFTFRWGSSGYVVTRDSPLSGGGSSAGTSNATLASGLSLHSLTYRSDIVAIDEMGIWNAGLSYTDISDLYNSGDGRTHGDDTPSPPATPTTSLFGFHGFAT